VRFAGSPTSLNFVLNAASFSSILSGTGEKYVTSAAAYV